MSEFVLVIEDEKVISDLIRYNLEREGFRVASEADGEKGLDRLFSARPDVVILDLMLPGRNGLEVLRELRKDPTGRDIPVIVLTARSAEMDKLLGFEHGADDYLTKPFSPRELVARVRALLRRSQPIPTSGAIQAGRLRIDLFAHEAWLAEEKLLLTRREFDLLAFLALHPGRVLSREELLRKVWNYDFVGETRTIDVHIRRLRTKLGEDSSLIETVTRVGYKFAAPQ
jgi:DNA-binding response OmpR family regulator